MNSEINDFLERLVYKTKCDFVISSFEEINLYAKKTNNNLRTINDMQILFLINLTAQLNAFVLTFYEKDIWNDLINEMKENTLRLAHILEETDASKKL